MSIIPISFIKNSGYDESAEAWFQQNEDNGNPVDLPTKIMANKYILFLKSRNKWESSDCRFIGGLSNKEWSKVCMVDPTRSLTLVGSYGGEHTANEGWNGNGDFGLVTNFNPGDGVGTYNYTRDDSALHVLLLRDNSAPYVHEVSCMNGGFTEGTLIQAYDPFGHSTINGPIAPVDDYIRYRATSYCWHGNIRTGANNANVFVNGFNTETQVSASVPLENKPIALMGAYNGAFAPGFFTLNSHAVFVAGSSDLDQATEMEAYNYAFNHNNVTNITHRIIGDGDSRTGSAFSFAQSVDSAYMRYVGTTLGEHYSICIASEANDKMESIVTQAATKIDPYRMEWLEHDCVHLFAGTNDIEAGRSAADIFADIITYRNERRALGFKLVIFGEIDRNWTNYAAGDATRAALEALMLAEFPTSLGSNMYQGADPGVIFVNLHEIAGFQSYASGLYQGDGIHPDNDGAVEIGQKGVAANQILVA